MTGSTPEVQAPQRKKGPLGLHAPQLLSGALAAVTTALLASRLGVNGTIVGAAFGSVISAVGGAFYTRSLDRAQQRVVITRDRLAARTLPLGGGSNQSDVDKTGVEETVVEPDGEADAPAVEEPTPGEEAPSGEQLPRRRGWKPWAIVAVALFAVAMLAITLIETVLGHPVSGSSDQGTTVTRLWQGGSPSEPLPSPSVDPSATPSGEASPDPSADVSPSSVETALVEPSPGDTATDQPTEPAPTEPAPSRS